MTRELLQQALDALENSYPEPLDGEDTYAECAWAVHCEAKRALEAELAKPERKWVGLIREDVESWELPSLPTIYEFTKFVEAKIKEKNNGL